MKWIKSSLAALVLLLALNIQGGMVGGILLPKEQDGLTLNGAGLLRKGFVFKIYVGALYIENDAHTDQLLTNVPKRIDIHYFHHTPKKHMVRVAEKTLEKNLPREQLEELLPKVEKLHEAFMNGQKGSFASIVHQPGTGLVYAFDDQPVITIPCDDFANAYFSIWLGEQPSSETMKEAMLNKG